MWSRVESLTGVECELRPESQIRPNYFHMLSAVLQACSFRCTAGFSRLIKLSRIEATGYRDVGRCGKCVSECEPIWTGVTGA